MDGGSVRRRKPKLLYYCSTLPEPGTDRPTGDRRGRCGAESYTTLDTTRVTVRRDGPPSETDRCPRVSDEIHGAWLSAVDRCRRAPPAEQNSSFNTESRRLDVRFVLGFVQLDCAWTYT
jgi:hypothetical protein